MGSIHDPGVVRIDRSTKWGNPFVLGRDGDRATVIAKYEEWIKTQPELLAALPELRGRSLGCHCAPLPCHGDVLMRLANPDTPVSRDWDAGARAEGLWDDVPEGYGQITPELADQMATAAGVPQNLARAAERDAADAALIAKVDGRQHDLEVKHATWAYQSPRPAPTINDLEGHLTRQVQDFDPQWDRLGQRRLNVEERPQLNPTLPEDAFRLRQWEEREAVMTQPYTLWETEMADRWWAEAADQHITAAAHRIMNTPKGMEFVARVREESVLHSAMQGIADQIDMDIRLARVGEAPMNPWRGSAVVPERVVDRAIVSKRDQASVRSAEGTPEGAAADARREARFKNVTKWDDKSPREQALIRRRDAVYGIVRDKDGNVVKSEVTVVVDKEGVKHVRGGKKVTERRPDQLGVDEQGNTVYPNKPAKKEQKQQRDKFDAEQTSDAEYAASGIDPKKLEAEAKVAFREDRGFDYDGKQGTEEWVFFEKIKRDLARKKGWVPALEGDTPARGAGASDMLEQQPFYGGRDEMLSGEGGTVELTTPTNVPPKRKQPERPKKISTTALATIKRAEDIYREKYGRRPAHQNEGVGMDVYTRVDRERMSDIIREMAYKG